MIVAERGSGPSAPNRQAMAALTSGSGSTISSSTSGSVSSVAVGSADRAPTARIAAARTPGSGSARHALGRRHRGRRTTQPAEGPERGRPDGRIGVIVDGPDEHRPGSLDRRPAEKVGRHPSHAGLIRPQGADQGVRRGGVPGQGAQTRAALEDLLAEASAQAVEDARPVAPADPGHDQRAQQRRQGAQPEDLVAREERAGGQEQQAGQDRPDLARDAVVEGQDLGATLPRDDVVERAPGGIRDAALGRPAGRTGRSPRWRSRTRPATARSRPGTRSAGGGRPRRPRTARRPGWRAPARRRTRWRSWRRTAGRGRSPGPPRSGTCPRPPAGTGRSPRRPGWPAGRRRPPPAA